MSEDSSNHVPALPGPVVKAICSCLPINLRCEARLVSRGWRIHAGEAVNSIAVDPHQLKQQVLSDFTAHQVTQQLRKAAAAEAAAAGGTPAQVAAAAAAVTLNNYLQPQESIASSSSSTTGLRKRGGRHAAAGRQQHRRNTAAAAAERQRQLNELHITAFSRRLAAAFPAAVNALVALDVGGHGPAAAADPAVVAEKLLLLLSQCKQLARLRLNIMVTGGRKKQHEHNHDQQQQQPQQPQQQQGGNNADPAGVFALPAWIQQQQPVAAAMAAAQAELDEPQQPDDDDNVLGFDPDDSDYCYGWIVRFLQHLQQQQQGVGSRLDAHQASSSSSSNSCILPAVRLKMQLLQPVLIWKQSDLQQQQQQKPWSQNLASSSSHPATPGSSSSPSTAAATSAPAVPLVLELCIDGAAYPRDAEDWQQLCCVSSAASLLLPEHRPALLPGMVKQGLAGLTQLRALHLSVDAGYTSATAAQQWGVGPGLNSSSSITALGQLTRLTHLALQTQGCNMREVTAAVLNLTSLRALLLSGNSMLFLPAVIPRLSQLELLVLQQQVSLHDLDLITRSCPRLKYLESLGVIETAGAAQNLLPHQLLLPRAVATGFFAAAAAAAGMLLGPGADTLSRQNPRWLTVPEDPAAGEAARHAPTAAAASYALSSVAAAFYGSAPGDAGRAAAEPAKLMWLPGHMPGLLSDSSSGTLSVNAMPVGPPTWPKTGSAAGAAAAAATALRPRDERFSVFPGVSSLWCCQLLSAQDELKQAVMAFTANKLHMNDSFPPLFLQHTRDSTPAVSTLGLLQLAAAAVRSAERAAVAEGMVMEPGSFGIVREDHMPAGAVADLLDQLLCASPFDPPADPTPEQQQQDLAAEQAALTQWKTQQHCSRTERNILSQQQQQEDGTAVGAAAAAAAAVWEDASDEGLAAAAADPGTAAGSDCSNSDDMARSLSQHVDWESYALQLQQWLQDRYSTGPSSINPTTTTTSSTPVPSTPGLKRMVLCVGSGSDMSLIWPSLPALESLVLCVPPCIASFKTLHLAPADPATLPQLQLWMGHDRDVGIGGDSSLDPAADVGGGGGAGDVVGDSGTAHSSSGSGSRAADTHVETDSEGQQQQQWQQQWHDLMLQAQASFSGSFLAQQRQAISLHSNTPLTTAATTTTSSSSRGEGGLQPATPASHPTLLPPVPPNPSCYFSNLKALTISNLTRHDGPWEPSATLGDAAVAAAALGCPRLEDLELSGVLRVSGCGLLLLRRCEQLKTLRLEQWTNTATQLSAQQSPLAVCCLPHGLTSLTLINVHPITHIHPLAAVATAMAAAGGKEGITAAAQTEAVAAAWRGAAAVDVAAVTAAAEAVIAAAGGADRQQQQQQQQQESLFLGLGIACKRGGGAAAGTSANGNASSASSSKMLIGSRDWFTPECLALLLLDTFFGNSSSSGGSSADVSMQQSLARLCCSCSCPSCSSHMPCSTSSSSSSSNNTCCLSGIFSRLDDLTIVAHGPGFEAHRRLHRASGAAAGGLHPLLAAALPHAPSLKSIHVTAPGSFSSLTPSAALLYGALSATNAATLYTLASPLTAAAAAALQSGAFDAEAPLLQRCRRLLSAPASSSGSNGGVACGSMSSSYKWLRSLGDCPVLRDVHLDLPLIMPGQLESLVSAVSSSHSITSLSLHGLVINLYSSHTQLLHTLAQLKSTSPQPPTAAAATAPESTAAHPAEQENTFPTLTPAAAAAGDAHTSCPITSSSSGALNPLRRVDISLTKHTLLPPVGLSLCRMWAATKAQRHAAATAGELAMLQQLREVLMAAQQHIMAGQQGNAVPGGAAAGLAVPNNAVAAVMNVAMQIAAAGAGADDQQQLLQLAQALEQLAAGAGQQPQQQPAAAAAQDPQPAAAAAAAEPPQPAGAAGAEGAPQAAAAAAAVAQGAPQPVAAAAGAEGAPQPAAAAAAAAVEAMLADEQQGGPLGLINNILAVVDHQIHVIVYHGPAAAAPYIMTHAAAANLGDKSLVRCLRHVLQWRGVTTCSVRLHGSSMKDRAAVGSHGRHSAEGGTGWTGPAAVTGHTHAAAAATESDDTDGGDYDDSEDLATTDDPDSSEYSETIDQRASGGSGGDNVHSLASNSLPKMHISFWDHTGLSAAADTLCSVLMAAFSTCLSWISTLGPKIQRAKWPGAGLAFKAWKLARNVFIGSAVAMLLISLAVATYCGWEDLEGVLWQHRADQHQQQEGDDGGSSDDEDQVTSDHDESASWVEDDGAGGSGHESDHESATQCDGVTPAQQDVSDGDTSDFDSASSVSDQDGDHDEALDEPDHQAAAAAAVVVEQPAAAAAAQQPGAAADQPPAGGGGGGGGGPLGILGLGNLAVPGGNAGMELIDQGIQNLLGPDGELLSPEGIDESGGTSGVPPQVQVLGQLDSAASISFMLGAVPVWVFGAWVWFRQFRWLAAVVWVCVRWLCRTVVHLLW